MTPSLTNLRTKSLTLRGFIVSETEDEIVFRGEHWQGETNVIRIPKTDVLEKDGVRNPWRPSATQRRAPPGYLLLAEALGGAPYGVLFFEAPVKAGPRKKIEALVPPPARYDLRWLAHDVFVFAAAEHHHLDVRITYNDRVAAFFAKKRMKPFAAKRFDVLVDNGLGEEPTAREVAMFARAIAALLDGAHELASVALAYLVDGPETPKLTKRAEASAGWLEAKALPVVTAAAAKAIGRGEDAVRLRNLCEVVRTLIAKRV